MIDKTDFQMWKDNPATQQVLKYFSDFRQTIINAHQESLENGVVVSEEDQIRDGEKLILLQTIIDLEIEDMEDFYEEKPD